MIRIMSEAYNVMEMLVYEITEEVLKMPNINICKCKDCKTDIMLYVLNKLPSKYVRTAKGRIYSELETLKRQYKVDVLRYVMEAVEVISRNPSHKSEDEEFIDDLDKFLEAFEGTGKIL